MEMDYVELIGAPADVVEHYEVARDMIADAGEPQPFGHARNQLCRAVISFLVLADPEELLGADRRAGHQLSSHERSNMRIDQPQLKILVPQCRASCRPEREPMPNGGSLDWSTFSWQTCAAGLALTSGYFC